MVFSDDIKNCRRNLFNQSNIFYSENNYLIDFCAMSLCDHNIISSSTFGWWAAYLNKNPKKEVLMGQPWFKKSSKCYNTFYKDHFRNFKIELYPDNFTFYDPINIKFIE